MFPILVRLGPVIVYTYTVLIDIGIAAGLGWLYVRAPEGKSARWLDAGIAATVGGFVGARLLYAMVNGGYYLGHLGEVFRIWEGGLAWPGAALGGLVGLWAYGGLRARESLAPILDALALPMALVSLLSWGGCLAGSCAYGYEVTPGQLPAWLVMNAPDLYNLTVPRFPTQAIGLAWSLIALVLVWGMRDRRWPVGAHGFYALSLVALGTFGLAFTRGDPMPLVNGIRLDVVGSALVFVAASLIWGWLVSRKPPLPTPQLPIPDPNSNSSH